MQPVHSGLAVSLVAVGYVPPLTESMESSGGLWHLGENAAQEKNALRENVST